MSFLFLYWKYIAAAAILAVLVTFYNLHVHNLIVAAETKAVTENNRSWQEAEKKAIAKSEADARATEAAHATALAAISGKAKKDIANAKIQASKDVADARSGALKLRYPATGASACDDSKTPAAPAGSDGKASTELPSEITANLFALADDADAVVNQLTSCQQVIFSDRKEVSP